MIRAFLFYFLLLLCNVKNRQKDWNKFITLYLNYLRLLLLFSIIYYRYVYFDYLPNSLSLSVFSFLVLFFSLWCAIHKNASDPPHLVMYDDLWNYSLRFKI